MQFKKILKPLDQKGTAFHIILPIIVVIAVAAIGVYMLRFSSAATYSGPCTGTTYAAPNSSKQPCIQQAQDIMDAMQHQNYKSYRSASKLVAGSTFQYGSEYYLIMNGLFGSYTTSAVEALPGNSGKVGKLTAGSSGTWQLLCNDAVSAGLNSGAAGGATLDFKNSAGKMVAGQYTSSTNATIFKATCGSEASAGVGSASPSGAAFLSRAEEWKGLGYANLSDANPSAGGIMHSTSGYAGFVKTCEHGSDDGTPDITGGLNSTCATDCSGFVSMVVDDITHASYVWIAGDGVLTGTGASNWVPVNINSAEPGDIAVGDDHVEFVKSGTGQGMTTYGEHASGQVVGNGGDYGIVQVYRWK